MNFDFNFNRRRSIAGSNSVDEDNLFSTSGLDLLATVSTPPCLQPSPRNLSPGFSSPPPSPSIPRRRHRESDDPDTWTRNQKLRYAEFATSACAEYDVSGAEKEGIVEKSQLSTHELLISLYARLARDQNQASESAGQTWLKSPQYKEHVVTRLYAILLDPSLSSYKTGLLSRCLRHICLHPNQYKIPKNIHDFIPSKAFATHLSKSLASCRAELKRKLLLTWDKKKDIHTVLRTLVGTSGVTTTHPMRERWSFIQFKLIDYRDDKNQKQKQFWDSIDESLQSRRDKFKHLPMPDRSAEINRIFELTLKKHLTLHPPTKQPATSNSIPAWQKDIARAVQEMEAYSDVDLAQTGAVDADDEEVEFDEDELNAAIEREEMRGSQAGGA